MILFVFTARSKMQEWKSVLNPYERTPHYCIYKSTQCHHETLNSWEKKGCDSGESAVCMCLCACRCQFGITPGSLLLAEICEPAAQGRPPQKHSHRCWHVMMRTNTRRTAADTKNSIQWVTRSQRSRSPLAHTRPRFYVIVTLQEISIRHVRHLWNPWSLMYSASKVSEL